jgi:competence protein ComEC
MKRPLVLFSISLAVGILAAHISQSVLFAILVAVLFIVCIFMFVSKSSIIVYIFAGMLLFYTLGASLYLYESRCSLEKYKDFAGKQVTVRGIIDSEPGFKGSRVSYVLRTREIVLDGTVEIVEGKILLNTLGGVDSKTYEYGQKVAIEGELAVPRTGRNPGGFNYKEYLAQSGVAATIFVRRENLRSEGLDNINPAVKAGYFLRKNIVNTINRSLPAEQAGLLNGMLIGYREGLTDDLQGAFSDSGLSHIMAVSGANVAFIVFPLLFVLRKLRVKQAAANIITIAVLVVFVLITGADPSVLRAVIMAVVILVAQIVRRETDIYTSIALAAIILMLSNPFTIFNIGFQLSFAATLSIVLFYKYIQSVIKNRFLPEVFSSVIAATLAAQCGVLPITLYYFNSLSVISLLTNVIVVPLTGLITVLGMLMAAAGSVAIVLSQLLGYINFCLLSFVLMVVKFAASLPFAVIVTKTPALWQIIAYYCLILFFLWYKPLKKIKVGINWYAAGTAVLWLVILVPLILPKPLEVVFLDVGEGDSAFIRTSSGRTVLIDGGGSSGGFKQETNIGETTVIPFLLDYGVTKLDLVIATHGHDDHIQGLIPVLEDFKTETLVIPLTDGDEFDSILGTIKDKEIKLNKLNKLRNGDVVRLDSDTFIDVLNPGENNYSSKSYLNNTSLVLKLHYKDVSMLFAGDAESEVEEQLADGDYALTADILKAAHHGSDTSTAQSFLDEVNPKAVVVSVGKNSFGHPSPSVLDRINAMGISLFRTDEDGAIIIKTYGKKLEIKKTVG